MLDAFHGKAGIARIADDLVDRNKADPRIADIFKGQDEVRLRRLLKEQFCYILNGGCDYSGRAMKDAHRDMGLQTADFGRWSKICRPRCARNESRSLRRTGSWQSWPR